MARRIHGEGSVFQRCEKRYGCPALTEATTPDGSIVKVRPAHKCRGRWFYAVDLGYQGRQGRKQRARPTVSARTLKELRPKMALLDERVRTGVDATGSTTVETWLNWWLAEIAPITAKSPRTRDTYRGYVDNWLIPHIGSKRLDRLKPDDLRALYRVMANAGKSPLTIRQVHAIITKALKVAEDDGKIIRSPATPVTPPGGDKGSHGKLTLIEARKVLTILATRPDRARWYAALLLGLRQGEALGLAWEDIDDEHGVIHVRHSLGRVKGKGLQLGDVKSQASRRTLPLLPELRAALADVPRTGALVWGPKDNKADWNEWQALLAAAGVERHSLHAARATTASILSDMNVPTKIISEILGHAQTTTTEAHYIHGDLATHSRVLEGMAHHLIDG